jgi:hypothetical protein
MDLEQFYVFPIKSPLNNEKRKIIEAEIAGNAAAFEKDVSFKWLKRGDEKFMRILVEPVTIEIVFFDDRVELYGAAPTWARLMFTKARKQELQGQIESVLIAAGFVVGESG